MQELYVSYFIFIFNILIFESLNGRKARPIESINSLPFEVIFEKSENGSIV